MVNNVNVNNVNNVNVNNVNVYYMSTFIGICGGSSSGKTTISNYLYNYMKDSTQISLDNYTYVKNNGTFKTREEYIKNTNFDCPEAYNIDLLLYHLKELRAGREKQMPIYDFKTSTYSGFKIVRPKNIVLIDGILLFSKLEILKQLDLCIFIECDDDVRNKRRVARDTVERGASSDVVAHQLNTTVNPMFYKYVFPNRHYADIVFNNTQSSGNYNLHKKLFDLYKKVIEHIESEHSDVFDTV